MTELIELTAADAAAKVRAREIDPAELFEAYRERAAADELNAFTWIADRPPQASPVEQAPLGGVPLAVKDLFCTEGVPSQAGSRILEGYRPPYTATVVDKLTAAGAPLLGKTNQDEFAMGSSTENSGFGPVLNPWDRGRVPGGSSGGSAAAVAAGLAPWAIGTDTGGSIRQPASLCGIVGVKPTYGACSRYGMIAFASSLDQAGPLTRNVTDAALLLSQMVGHDPLDSTSLEYPGSIGLPRAEDLRGIRLGVPEDLLGGAGIEPGVRESFEATIALAEGLGATVEPCRLPHAPHALSAYYLIAPAEASANLARLTESATGCASTGTPIWRRCTAALARSASAPRSSAASCSAPTRCRAATTTPTTGPRRRSGRRSPRTSRPRLPSSISSSPRPAPGPRSSSEPRPMTRWRCI